MAAQPRADVAAAGSAAPAGGARGLQYARASDLERGLAAGARGRTARKANRGASDGGGGPRRAVSGAADDFVAACLAQRDDGGDGLICVGVLRNDLVPRAARAGGRARALDSGGARGARSVLGAAPSAGAAVGDVLALRGRRVDADLRDGLSHLRSPMRKTLTLIFL